MMASSRMQRWALKLAGYNYTAISRGLENSNADAISRLPLKCGATEDDAEGEIVLVIERLDTSPVTARQVKAQTAKDPCLAVIREWIMSGWPQALEKTEYANQDEVKSYCHRRHELSVHDECFMWGHRVAIPSKARRRMLEVLHEGQQGISKAKVLARGYISWPKIDGNLERTVRSCVQYQEYSWMPAVHVAPLHLWYGQPDHG